MKRLSLITYDVVRELCDNCGRERFHFVPMGASAAANGRCKHCAGEAKAADVSDTSIFRLVTQPDGEVVVVPLIARPSECGDEVAAFQARTLSAHSES